MSKRVGKDCAVKLSTNQIVGIGNWSMDGVSTEEFDASEFGDEWKDFLYGMKDGGSISFAGHYDPDDANGQEALREANLYNSALTTLRLYIDNTSYYEPCQTTGYFSPTLTTGAPTEVATVNITTHSANMDKSGIGACSFTAKVSGGPMVLV